MKNHFLQLLEKVLLSSNPIEVDSILVTSFMKINRIPVQHNKLIKSLYKDSKLVDELIASIKKNDETFDFEQLIKAFEFVISPSDKIVNGAIYTPADIREYIIKGILRNKQIDNESVYADISCGCGGFFYSLARILKEQDPSLSLVQLYQHLIGIDIADYSIQRTKILLSLFAIYNREDVENINFQFYVHNTLDFDFNSLPLVKETGVDVVFGNPPYVGINNISQENRLLLKKWEFTAFGKADMYLAFSQIGLSILKSNGILSYITLNTFITSLNGKAFRGYLSRHHYNLSIINFGGEQIFPGCSTYTCICTIRKKECVDIRYCRSTRDRLLKIQPKDFSTIRYDQLNDKDGWHLMTREEQETIDVIECRDKHLGTEFKIKTGFATLKNEVYLFRPKSETADSYILVLDNRYFKIERGICRTAINPNVLQTEDDFRQHKELIIYPYNIINGSAVLMKEDEIRTKYPNAYNYLLENKQKLSTRSCKLRPNEWYAYGRSQSMNNDSYKLLFPEMASTPRFILSKDRQLMYYNGSAILSEKIEDLKVLKKILSSVVFKYYIMLTSKPYRGNFYAISKRYIKNFGLPNLTADIKREILDTETKDILDRLICDIYGISYKMLEKYTVPLL